MYGNILTFLAAIVIQSLAPRNGHASWTISEIAHLLAYPVATWAGLRFIFRRLMARALHDEDRANSLQKSLMGFVQSYQNWMLAPFALFIYLTKYPVLALNPASMHSELFGNLLGILPFIIFLAILWWEAYPLHCLLMGRSGDRLSFVLSHARMELPVLAPWVIILALTDIFRISWPSGYAVFENNPPLQLLYLPFFLILLLIFMPVLIRVMWRCTPYPHDQLRSRMEELCKSLGVRIGGIFHWPLLDGQVMTAGIMGVVPRFRYLLITPALVNVLTPGEIEGVVAHEAGHVRYRHLLFYPWFLIGSSCVATIFFRLVFAFIGWVGLAEPEILHNPRADIYVSIGLSFSFILILALYFRVLFGFVSRAFERQADAFALESIGKSEPLVSALEQISIQSGDIRDLPSWHHGSIAERVDFLIEGEKNPSILKNHHSYVKRIKIIFGIGLVFSGVLAAAVNFGPIDRGLNLIVSEWGLKHRLASVEHSFRLRVEPETVSELMRLAGIYQEMEMLAESIKVYEEILLLKNPNSEALNNLAWLYITTDDPDFYKPERALALAEIAVNQSAAPHILDTYAEALFRVHDVKGALSAIQLALAKNPKNRNYYLTQRDKFLKAIGVGSR